MAEDRSGGVCMDHSGCVAKIAQLEKNDDDIFVRLRAIEMSIYKAAGATGVITAALLLAADKLMK